MKTMRIHIIGASLLIVAISLGVYFFRENRGANEKLEKAYADIAALEIREQAKDAAQKTFEGIKSEAEVLRHKKERELDEFYTEFFYRRGDLSDADYFGRLAGVLELPFDCDPCDDSSPESSDGLRQAESE